MKVALCGSGAGEDEEVVSLAFEIGKMIVGRGFTLLTGGGTGYPFAAVRGALSVKGDVVCYSPASSKEDHVSSYHFPVEEGISFVFTSEGIPGRNLTLVKNADVVVVVGGQVGTLNEFTLAMAMVKPLYVLNHSGGITSLLPKIVELCKKGNEKVEFFGKVEELRHLL